MNENLDSATEKKVKYAEHRDEILAAVNRFTGIDLDEAFDKAVSSGREPEAAYLEKTIDSILDGRTTLIHGVTDRNEQVHFRVLANMRQNKPYVNYENVKKYYSISNPDKSVFSKNCPEGYFEAVSLNGIDLSKDMVDSVLKENKPILTNCIRYSSDNIRRPVQVLLYSNREGNAIKVASLARSQMFIDKLKTFSFVTDDDGRNKKVYDTRPGERQHTDKETGEVVSDTQYRLVYFPPRSAGKDDAVERVNVWFSEQKLTYLSLGMQVWPDEIENGAIDIRPMKLNLDTGYLENSVDLDLTEQLNEDLREGYHKCIDTYGLKGANRMIFRMKEFYPSLDIVKAKDKGEKETQVAEKTESVEKKEKPSVKKSPAAKKPAEKAEKVVSGPRIK